MSMLAEPRRKQKFSPDPRGSLWSNDENKFGQKMLERMGWKKGRGLGANEDGKTEHVKITHKMDNKGVGCSVNYADSWIAHQDDFNALLANLNQDHGENLNKSDDPKVVSLEQKSKSSKSRVHYQKFTKGKDLSAKSLQDLDCVFGKRKKNSAPTTPQGGSEANSEDEENESYGINVVKSEDNVQEYFAKKMAQLKNSRNLSSSVIANSDSSKNNEVGDAKIVKKVRFQLGDSSTDEGIDSLSSEPVDVPSDEIDQSNDIEEVQKKCKKKKKKLRKKKEPEPVKDHHKPNACRKKRKKKKEYEKKELEASEDILAPEAERKKAKKKKKKAKKNEEDDVKMEACESFTGNLEETQEPVPKKKKGKKKSNDKNNSTPSKTDVCNEKLECGENITSDENPKSEDSNLKNYLKRKLDENENTSNKKRKIKKYNYSQEEKEVKKVCNAFVGSNLEAINGYASSTQDLANSFKKYKIKKKGT